MTYKDYWEKYNENFECRACKRAHKYLVGWQGVYYCKNCFIKGKR